MALPLAADMLLQALVEEGALVEEVGAWRDHNRNHRGAWGPVNGVMLHHTVTSGTEGSLQICRDGRTALPGPLCHGVIAKDGTVYLVGNGRANHAGLGDDEVLQAVSTEQPLPEAKRNVVDGNARFYGFECINLGDGEDCWPEAQIEAMVRTSAALCRAHGWGKIGPTSVIGHCEWQVGKIDPCGPGFPGMTEMRARVAERLTH